MLAGWRTCQSPGWRVTGRRRRTGSSLKEADVPCTDIQHEAPNETGHTTIKLKLRQKLYLELPNFLSTTKVNQYFQLVGVSKVFNVNPYQSPIYLEDKHTSFSVPRWELLLCDFKVSTAPVPSQNISKREFIFSFSCQTYSFRQGFSCLVINIILEGIFFFRSDCILQFSKILKATLWCYGKEFFSLQVQ